MKLTKRVLLYAVTIVVIIGAFIWNSRVEEWLKTQEEPEMIVRSDLLVIYPLVITLVALSLFALYRDWKEKSST